MQQEKKALLFQYEVLRARLDIRDFFLKTAVKEVYENIGQVLSLVRMQLAFVEPGAKEVSKHHIASSGDLVGQSIRDLRSMCKSFYPDVDILNDGGVIDALQNTVTILQLNELNAPSVEIKGIVNDVAPGLKLVTFKMLLDILTAIKENQAEYLGIKVTRTKEGVVFEVSFKGNDITLNDTNTRQDLNPQLTLKERVELINGDITIEKSKAGVTKIFLITPTTI